MRVNTLLITSIAEELAPYKDDQDAFWDTLDAETDVLDLVGQVLKELSDAEAGMIACQEMVKRYNERKSLMDLRKVRLNKILKTVMLCCDETKIPHPLATVSLRNGMQSVVIKDEKAIPTQLCKTTVTPDKAEIKKQLKAGVEIDGAELVTGQQTISVRMK